MATAVEEHVYPEVAPPPLIPVLPVPIKTRPRHHWARWTLVAGIVIALAVGVELWRMHSQNAIGYETVPVERGLIQASVTATGTVNAVVDVQVGSQVSGNIKALYADFNTKVTKGQLVALIDPQVFQTQVDQAQAAVASFHSAAITAEAQIQKAKADLAGTIASEKSVESGLAKDRATALNASNQFQRQDSLFKDGLISQQDHDLAKATVDAAEAQVAADQSQIEASKQTIESAQAQVNVAQAQLGSAQAQDRQAQASLEQAKLNLAHTQITAPVDGTVIARRMDVGQTVAASFAAPTIFEIAQDLTKMQLDTNVDESDIGNISTGQNATFTVDAYPGTTFSGQVTAVRKAPINAQNVVTYDVVIAVANPDLKLFPGMTANARIFTAKLDNTLKVPNAVLRVHPSAAVVTQLGLPAAPAGRQQVYVLAGGQLRAVPATFGLSDGKSTAVTAGDLKEGDRVVTRFTTATSAPAVSAPSAPGASGARRGPGF
ncbi:MAG TPA: efflux RND transporter periplasmic adaptor subunit [Terriglobales bacterium]|jgi:HlyD family secretion protein|nr:efflux RND transporter periplasmic adaptor subunit [Terriglobales bacterium]